MAVNIAYTTR